MKRDFIRIASPSKLLLISAAIGLVVGLIAVGFRSLIVWCNGLFFPQPPEQLALLGAWWKYLVFLIPAGGGLIVGLLLRLLINDKHRSSGVTEVIEAVFLKSGRLNLGMGFKGLLSVITIGSGGSAGPEGPIVEIGSSFSSFIGQRLRLPGSEMRLLAACGAAAGISAVFGAPLGGIFFVLEIILGEFAISTFAPVVLSSVIAAIMAKSLLGSQPAFQTTVGSIGSLYDVVPFALLGVLSGLVSVLFLNALQHSGALFSRWRIAEWMKPAVGGLLVGVLGLVFPRVLGEGYHAVTAVMAGQVIWWAAILLMLAKILATSITLGSGSPGGSFAPAVFIGAMLGSAVCQLMALVLPSVFTYRASYALAGAAGLVAGALNAPITAALIVFEISGSYAVILPVLLVVALSALLTYRIRGASVYTLALADSGLTPGRIRKYGHLSAKLCSEVMRQDIKTVSPTTNIRTILAIMNESDQSILPIVESDEKVRGVISWSTVKYYLGQEMQDNLVIAHDIMMPCPVVEADDPVTKPMMILLDETIEAIPVVRDGKVLGIIGRRELLRQGLQDG